MKRILKLALLIGLVSILCVLLLTACECKHKEVEWRVTPAKCTTDGKEELCCVECNTVFETKVIPAAHNHKVVLGYAPTCYSEGLTDGVVCTVCKATLLAQSKLAPVDHVFSNDEDQYCNMCAGNRTCSHTNIKFTEGTPATCDQVGTSSHASCEDCGMCIIPEMTLEPTGHNVVCYKTDPVTKKNYYRCSKCYEEILVEDDVDED